MPGHDEQRARPRVRVPLTKGRWDRATTPLLLSLLGSSAAAIILITVLGQQVYGITGRELDLGLLGLAEFAPAAVLVLVTGSIADRRDRRRVAAAGLVAQALAIVGLLWYVSGDPTAVGPIFAFTVLFGIGRAFTAPTLRSLPADAVPPTVLPWLTSRVAASFQLASIGGPVIGAFLYAAHHTIPYALVVVLLLLSAVAVLAVRLPPDVAHDDTRDDTRDDAGDSVTGTIGRSLIGTAEAGLPASAPTARERLHDALEGLRFIRHQPVLLGAITLDLFAVLFGGAIALLPAIADNLGAGDVGYGWLRAATGIGAGIVTLALAWRPLHRHVGKSLLVAVAVFGLGTIVLGITSSYTIAFIALLVASGADSLSVFIRSTLVPLVTPRDKRGRVLAVEMVFIGASNELGAFESGVAGQLFGPMVAVVFGGFATLAVASVWWVVFPVLRDTDRFPQPGAPEEPRPDRTPAPVATPGPAPDG